MSSSVLEIPHLYRVEGHGGIRVTVGDQGIEDCQMSIFEGSRFYEALLRDRKYFEVPGIVCRVCAICSVAHSLCSTYAIEDALGLAVSRPIKRLRDLLNMGEFIESHALHLFCLATPDYLGFSGVLEMQPQFDKEVRQALQLKKFGNLIQERIGGRAIHPVNVVIGGVGTWPEKKVFDELREGAQSALAILRQIEPLIASLQQEDYATQDRVYVALEGDDDGLILGHGERLQASGHEPVDIHDYSKYVNESVVRHSTAKQSRFSNRPFMVGSLSRMVHHSKLVTGEAGQILRRLMGEQPAPNPLLNNAGQFVELVYCCEQVIQMCDELRALPTQPSADPYHLHPEKTVRGTAAMEVPRGTLFHSYEINEEGHITDADIITPTAQNLAQVESD
ncbi:MAG: nickel-dependent hydrogenase large subunit, partial [Deltaproteobacteria bacterium]